jgi:hypothetical protein
MVSSFTPEAARPTSRLTCICKSELRMRKIAYIRNIRKENLSLHFVASPMACRYTHAPTCSLDKVQWYPEARSRTNEQEDANLTRAQHHIKSVKSVKSKNLKLRNIIKSRIAYLYVYQVHGSSFPSSLAD